MLSLPHLIVLFVVALVIFGPQKLPELARMLGKATAEFRKMTSDFRYALEDEVRELERQTRLREAETASAFPQPPPPQATAPAAPTEGTLPRDASVSEGAPSNVDVHGLPLESQGKPLETASAVEPPVHADPSASVISPDPVTPIPEKPSDDNAAV